MNCDQQEKFLQDKLSEFAQQMKELAEKVISDVEVEYLPHVLTDTDLNVSSRVGYCIRKILKGEFEILESGVVTDGVYVAITDYDNLATAIYNKAKDKVENAAIKELQGRVNTLEEQLKQAYSRY